MAGRLRILPLFCLSPRTPKVPKAPFAFWTTCRPTSSSAVAASSEFICGEVVISYTQGILEINVPLPSKPKKCHIILKPINTTVRDFLTRLKSEDNGIEHLAIYSMDGVRVATSTGIEILMQENFLLHLNDRIYTVTPPYFEDLTSEQLDSLSSVKSQVSRLHEVLHASEFQERIKKRSYSQLDHLKLRLEPLEKKKADVSSVITKRQTIISWTCLSVMGMQLGVIARLTWWEFSWDVMEPVTYFITYGTTMAMYAYYILTRQEYTFPGVRDRHFLSMFYRESKKSGMNVNQYNEIQNSISQIEEDLNRLKDPQQVNLPIKELRKKVDVSQEQ